jgi:hypothetical protein
MRAENNMISLGSKIDTMTEKLEKNKKIKLIEMKKNNENENSGKTENKEEWNNGKPAMSNNTSSKKVIKKNLTVNDYINSDTIMAFVTFEYSGIYFSFFSFFSVLL